MKERLRPRFSPPNQRPAHARHARVRSATDEERAVYRMMPRSLVIMAFAAVAITSAGAQTADKTKHMIEGVRDARYCEIIPVVRRGIHLVATIYNTLGHND